VDLAVIAALLAGGWLSILAVNRWYVGPPVVFLALGWLAVCLCGWFFWNAAKAAGAEGTGEETQGFDLSAGRLGELDKEKRALLKAIKEVEFDREMGKMSEADAAEITRVYRARAIDVIKELEGEGDSPGEASSAKDARDGSLERVIDREVRARLALAGVAARKPARPKAAAAPTGASSKSGPDPKPAMDRESASDAPSASGSESGSNGESASGAEPELDSAELAGPSASSELREREDA